MAKLRYLNFLCLVLASLALSTTSASAQGATIVITKQDVEVEADATFQLELSVPNNLDDFEIDVTIFEAISSSTNSQGGPLHKLQDITLTPAQNINSVSWSLQLRSPGTSSTQGTLLPGPGSYPIQLDLITDSQVLTSTTSYINVVNNSTPTSTILVLQPDVDTLSEALEFVAESDAPIHLALNPATLKELALDSELTASLKDSTTTAVIVYHSLEPEIDSLPSATQDFLFGSLLENFGQWLNNEGISYINDATFFEADPGASAAETLGRLQRTRLLAISSSTQLYTTPATRWVLTTPSLETELNSSQHVTAAAFRADMSDSLATVLVASRLEDIQALRLLLSQSTINFTRLDTLELPEDLISIDSQTESTTPLASSQDIRVTQLLNSYFTLGSATSSQAFEYANRYALLVNDGSQQLEMSALAAALESDLALTSVAPGQGLNVAATEATIPITLINAAQEPRQVRLVLDADKATIADPVRDILLQPGTNLVDVDLELRALGNSALGIALTTQDGSIVLSESEMTVRSTAFPGMGTALSVLALLSLASWWVISTRKERKKLLEPHIDLTKPTKTPQRL